MHGDPQGRNQLPLWEEQTERRLGIVEHKVDKLLDPETGIYPKLNSIEGRLSRWAIAILSSVMVGIIVQVAYGR